MEWKASFTAEEVTLFAFGLQEYETLEEAEKEQCKIRILKRDVLFEEQGGVVVGGMSSEELKETLNDIRQLKEPNMKGLRDLHESLLLEIRILCGLENVCNGYDDHLVIEKYIYKDEASTIIWPEKCTVTKDSLAEWFSDFGFAGFSKRLQWDWDSNKNIDFSRVTSRNYFWHKVLTSEQAALASISPSEPPLPYRYTHWQSFEEFRCFLESLRPPRLLEGEDKLRHEVKTAKYEATIRERKWQLKNAESIYDELIREVSAIAAQDLDKCISLLQIATYSYSDKQKKILNPAGCRIPKSDMWAWYESRGDSASAATLDPMWVSPVDRIENKEFVDDEAKGSTNYPAKLQLALDAHKHFYSGTNTTFPKNAEIKAWLIDESKKREANNRGRVTSLYGLSKINIEQIVVIIKPDDF